VEDANGAVISTVNNTREWRRQNRHMFAQVRNAKAKPIECFFRPLDVLLTDMILPGYSPPFPDSAAEDEEAGLKYQREHGYLLGSDEFIEKVRDTIVRYENRPHAGLKRSPLEELRYAGETEGWEPVWIDEIDIRHIFLESDKRTVKGNRIRICVRIADTTYVGSNLTGEMLKENRNNLAGLDGTRVQVYYDPDDPLAGAWAADPRNGMSIYLTPEEKIDPFNSEAVSEKLAEKRDNMKTVAGVYRETVVAAGNVLTSPRYKPLVEAKQSARKAVETKTGDTIRTRAMSNEDFSAAVAARLSKETEERVKHQKVFSHPTKRYQAILDTIIGGGELFPQDRLYKAEYESGMIPEEKMAGLYQF
jgi:putative transposase